MNAANNKTNRNSKAIGLNIAIAVNKQPSPFCCSSRFNSRSQSPILILRMTEVGSLQTQQNLGSVVEGQIEIEAHLDSSDFVLPLHAGHKPWRVGITRRKQCGHSIIVWTTPCIGATDWNAYPHHYIHSTNARDQLCPSR